MITHSATNAVLRAQAEIDGYCRNRNRRQTDVYTFVCNLPTTHRYRADIAMTYVLLCAGSKAKHVSWRKLTTEERGALMDVHIVVNTVDYDLLSSGTFHTIVNTVDNDLLSPD